MQGLEGQVCDCGLWVLFILTDLLLIAHYIDCTFTLIEPAGSFVLWCSEMQFMFSLCHICFVYLATGEKGLPKFLSVYYSS